MSILTELADAVAYELNDAPSGTFSPTFTAERKVLPVHELKDLKDLKVTVVPKAIEITGSTRATSQYDLVVDIGIQQKLPPATTDLDVNVTALGTLVDQIADYLRRRPLSLLPGVTWVGITNDPVYAPEHLLEQRVFTSVLTVTYRAMK
jgi:hypothetical protein